MKDKIYGELDRYMRQYEVFHQVIVPKLDFCKAAGAAVKSATTRTPTLYRPPWFK